MKQKIRLDWFIPLVIAFLFSALRIFTYRNEILMSFANLIFMFPILYAFRKAENKKEIFFSSIAVVVSEIIAYLFMFEYDGLSVLEGLAYSSLICLLFIPALIGDWLIYHKVNKLLSIFAFPLSVTIWLIICSFIKCGNYFDPVSCIAYIRIFAQSTRLIYEYGLMFIVLVTYTTILYCLESIEWKKKIIPASSLAGVFVFLFVYGGITMNTYSPKYTKSIKTALFHSATSGIWEREITFEDSKEAFANQFDTAAAEGVDFVVTHEEYFDCKPWELDSAVEYCSSIIQSKQIPALVCYDAYDTETFSGANVAYLFDKDGNIVFKYVKKDVLPLIEYPWYESGKNKPGYGQLNINGENYNFSVVICSDANNAILTSQIKKDTDILITPSWDFGDFKYYQKPRTLLRAIENNVTMFKPSYDGISYVVDPTGKVLQEQSSIGAQREVQFFNLPVTH